MFKSARFYAIINNKSLIIKKEDDDPENIMNFTSNIPNVPFYYHFFDEDKANIKDMRSKILKMKIRNLTIVAPDDAMDLEIDKRLLTEFFKQCGIKKVEVKDQCAFLSLNSKKYISISRTIRAVIVQYIVDNKSIVKKYYDKNYADIKQIEMDVKNLHIDCQYENIPVYVNDINDDMQVFRAVGTVVSLNDIIANIVNSKMEK